MAEMNLAPDLECPCGDTKIAGYFCDEELLGFFCQSCWKEWVLETFVSATIEPPVMYGGKKFISPIRSQLQESELCPVTTSREEINPRFVAESVKPGDHIMWHRPYFLWHHAIVENIDGLQLTLIHFNKSTDNNIAIVRATVDATKEWGTLYLVSYGVQVRQYNPVELVLARAKALIGMGGFKFLKKNCENFATFCKAGINSNQQGHWFANKLEEIKNSIWRNAGEKVFTTILKVGVAEMLELTAEQMKWVAKSSELVGAGVIIAFEGGICIWNLAQLYQKYRDAPKDGRKGMSRKDFIKEAVEQISQRLFAGVLGAVGGMALTALGTFICPGLGTVAGAVLGIIGGVCGSALGHVIGVTLGQYISRAIVATIMTNDRAVTINDLQPGDHLVYYGNIGHPRCHAIVLRVNEELKQIIVIRHSYKRGVIMDALVCDRVQPIFRVTYPTDTSTYSSHDVVNRAIKAIAEYDGTYNLLWNNCKHFVYSITVKPN